MKEITIEEAEEMLETIDKAVQEFDKNGTCTKCGAQFVSLPHCDGA